MEEQLTRKLTGALMGFKNGTKTGAEVAALLKQMKAVNSLMAEDFENREEPAQRWSGFLFFIPGNL